MNHMSVRAGNAKLLKGSVDPAGIMMAHGLELYIVSGHCPTRLVSLTRHLLQVFVIPLPMKSHPDLTKVCP